MRILPVRLTAYVLVLAAPCVAQPAPVETELPHVELSVGAQAMTNGPGADAERQMRALGFSSPDETGHDTPFTHAAGLLPGVFAAGHVAVARHVMMGLLIGTAEDETDGSRLTDKVFSSLVAYERVITAALVASYRPNRWFKVGGGPALHDRLLYVNGRGSREVVAEAARFGWMANAEGKFTRGRIEPDRLPVFGYVTAQYRRVPPLAAGARFVEPTNASAVPWPAATLHYSHWVIGIGAGLEF